MTKEHIYNIEWHSMLKTVVMPFWRKMTVAYENIIRRDSPARTHKGKLVRPGRESMAQAGWGRLVERA